MTDNYLYFDVENSKNSITSQIPKPLKQIKDGLDEVMRDIDGDLGIDFWCRPETIRISSTSNSYNGDYTNLYSYSKYKEDSYSKYKEVNDSSDMSFTYYNKAVVSIHGTYYIITINKDDENLVDIKTSESGYNSYSYSAVQHVMRSDGKLYSYMDQYLPVTQINEEGIMPEQAINKIVYAILTFLSPRSCNTIEIIADVPN